MRKFIIVITALLTLHGCVTPMIPLPPPLVDKMSLTVVDKSAGLVRFNYKPDDEYSGAFFYVFNRTTKNGIIQQANEDGSLTSQTFKVEQDQELSIWAQRSTDEVTSDDVNVRVDFNDPKGRYLVEVDR